VCILTLSVLSEIRLSENGTAECFCKITVCSVLNLTCLTGTFTTLRFFYVCFSRFDLLCFLGTYLTGKDFSVYSSSELDKFSEHSDMGISLSIFRLIGYFISLGDSFLSDFCISVWLSLSSFAHFYLFCSHFLAV